MTKGNAAMWAAFILYVFLFIALPILRSMDVL